MISARVHPGETNASIMMHGILEQLTGNTEEAKILRQRFIFKIIPSLNPDGVTLGHYRTSLLGVDLNRRWPKPSALIHPTIFSAKTVLKIMNEEHGVALFTDLHGHSIKKNCFMFGCQASGSSVEVDSVNAAIQAFPLIFTNTNRYGSFKDCKFSLAKEKESTARIVVFKQLGIVNSYTLESTFYGSDLKLLEKKSENSLVDIHMNEKDFSAIGKDFVRAIVKASSS